MRHGTSSPATRPPHDTAAAPPGRRTAAATRLRAWWSALVAVIATVVGLAPHVLHHIGLLAGTALLAGATGTTVFGLLGLAASVPFLLRLRRRFGTWWAPAIGLAVFTAMFSVSAFVIGPAISGGADGAPDSPRPSPSADHNDHHS